MRQALLLIISVTAMAYLFGCSSKPIIQTEVVDRPYPVYCKVETPTESKDAYAVDRVSTKDDPVTINRAFRQEIEERWACEVKLRAAVKGCNQPVGGKQVKLRWGRFRMLVLTKFAWLLGVPVKVREEYLEEHVFGMQPSKTLEQWVAERAQSGK